MVWGVRPMAMFCLTCGAALKLALPAWLASMTQSGGGEVHHAGVKVQPVRGGVQGDDDGQPEEAWRSACRCPDGAAGRRREVKVTVWLALATAKLCCTWVAAL